MTANDKTFELRNIGLVQAGRSILLSSGVFALGLFGSMAYSLLISHGSEGIFFHFRNGMILFALVYFIRRLFAKKKMKDTAKQLLIRILNGNIAIEIDKETVFSGKLDDLKAIRTLDPANKKNDVQAQVYLGDQTISLASSVDWHNKNEFDAFVHYCQKALKLQIKPVPFSIYTSNFQGVKYLEYFNPKNPLVADKRVGGD